MKLRLLLTALTAFAVSVPVAVHAQDSDQEHHTEIGKHMEKIAKAVKKLRSQIGDASQNDSSLQLVATIHDEASAAVDLKPEKEKDLPEDQQAQFQEQYQAGLKEFLKAVDKLSDLLKAGDNAGASAQLKQLLNLERQDHKKFKKPHKED